MRRAGILTGGVVALILLIGVYIPQHPSSSKMTHDSVDHNQAMFRQGLSPDGRYQRGLQAASTDRISDLRNE